jgi:hypothetical protein
VPWIIPGETHNPGYTGYDVSLSRPASSANSWLMCSSTFSYELVRRYQNAMVTVHLYFEGMHYFKIKYPDELMQQNLMEKSA